MALRTDRGAREFKAAGVGVVAIRADHAARIHQTLFKRLVVVDLVLHLAVILEQAGAEEILQVSIRKRLAGLPVFRKRGAAGMAEGTGFNLVAGGAGYAVRGAARSRVGGPVRGGARGGSGGKALVRDRRVAAAGGPRDVARAGAVAGFVQIFRVVLSHSKE